MKKFSTVHNYIVGHRLFVMIVAPAAIAILCLGGLNIIQNTPTNSKESLDGHEPNKVAVSSVKNAVDNIDSANPGTTSPSVNGASTPPTDNRPACPPQVTGPICSTTVKPKPETPRTVKALVFNKTNFVFRAGEHNAGAVIVKASTGEPIAMPSNSYQNYGPIFMSYSGGGSTTEKRTQWTMDLMVASDARPGTYASEVGASTGDSSFSGTFTVVVPSEPTFYISASMQQSGVYNYIAIDITRDAGFTENLTAEVSSAMPNMPMRCYLVESQNSGNRLLYYCYPDGSLPYPPRGTTLRAGITVRGSQQTRTTSIYWTY